MLSVLVKTDVDVRYDVDHRFYGDEKNNQDDSVANDSEEDVSNQQDPIYGRLVDFLPDLVYRLDDEAQQCDCGSNPKIEWHVVSLSEVQKELDR